MEIVTKEQYWIDILNDNSKFGQITTEDTSFNLRANDVWKVVENTLLDTEDEEEVMNWERITQLDSGELTIFQRKVNILYTLSAKNYVPISIIEKIVEKTAGVAFNVEWDKENDKVIVHTDRADTNTVEDTNSIINCVLPKFLELERYNHNLEISWDKLNKYAACQSVADLRTINTSFASDLTSDGTWAYSLPLLEDGVNAFFSKVKHWEAELPALKNGWGMFKNAQLIEWNTDLPKLESGQTMYQNSQLTAWNAELPKLTNGVDMFNGAQLSTFNGTLQRLSQGSNMFKGNQLTAWNVDLPNLTNGSDMFNGCKISAWNTELPKVEQCNGMFIGNKLSEWHIDLPEAINCGYMFYQKLKSFTGRIPKLQTGQDFLSNAEIDKNSVLIICDSIPSYSSESHPITLGIHVDNQNDEEVLAAIDNATAKGWTVTTQWNGTATTSTYSLRPTQSLPIYAKYEAEELGMYIDANNVRYSVNWGHMITNPDGKSPDELGYQEFASLEEALTTWGLTEIMEIPEQEF